MLSSLSLSMMGDKRHKQTSAAGVPLSASHYALNVGLAKLNHNHLLRRTQCLFFPINESNRRLLQARERSTVAVILNGTVHRSDPGRYLLRGRLRLPLVRIRSRYYNHHYVRFMANSRNCRLHANNTRGLTLAWHTLPPKHGHLVRNL